MLADLSSNYAMVKVVARIHAPTRARRLVDAALPRLSTIHTPSYLNTLSREFPYRNSTCVKRSISPTSSCPLLSISRGRLKLGWSSCTRIRGGILSDALYLSHRRSKSLQTGATSHLAFPFEIDICLFLVPSLPMTSKTYMSIFLYQKMSKHQPSPRYTPALE